MLKALHCVVKMSRLLALKNFSADVVVQFAFHVLSVPASIFYLHNFSPQVSCYSTLSCLKLMNTEAENKV